MSAAARFWGDLTPIPRPGYPTTPTRMFRAAPRTGVKRSRFTAGFGGGAFTRRVRGRTNGQMRGRYAGYYRKGGYYGRYNKGNGELKFYDLSMDDAVIASAGTIQDPTNPGPAVTQESICGIKQGTGESERIGRKCTIRSIGWRFNVTLPEVDAASTPASPDIVRIILYQDKQTNGQAATVTGILETANIHSFNNLSNTSRFKTLLDKVVTINYGTLASDNANVVSSAEVQRWGTFYKKCNIPLEFSSTTGALSELRSNNVNVLLISFNGVAGFKSQFRIRYSDSG